MMKSSDPENHQKPSRQLNDRDLAYDRIADTWENWIEPYDTRRRVEVLVENFLGARQIYRRTCLDAGCGLGVFTKALRLHAPTKVVAIDIAPQLIKRIREKHPDVEAHEADLMDLDASALKRYGKFDVILSSDVIEHTLNPRLAIQELSHYIKDGGLLAISVPNRRWKWLLILAQTIGLRKKYQGYENWISPRALTAWLVEEGFEIIRKEGIHTVPWQFLPRPVLRFVDRAFRKRNYSFALNLAVLARKKAGTQSMP